MLRKETVRMKEPVLRKELCCGRRARECATPHLVFGQAQHRIVLLMAFTYPEALDNTSQDLEGPVSGIAGSNDLMDSSGIAQF